MEDHDIVALYWRRDEAALAETERRYGRYCYAIANGILRNGEDARECVNDAFLAAWNAIPPHRPALLSAFLGKITRRLALKKRRDSTAAKRGGGSVSLSLDELAECFPAGQSPEDQLDGAALAELLDAFLDTLSPEDRRIFLRRYWYCDSVREIASRYGYSQSKVKMTLKRARDKLRALLEKEDIRL